METFKMPSPADLAKKDETANVSLRIKKSAIDIFDALAKEQNSKPGTMMISLIESYADYYRKQNQEDGKDDIISAKIIDAHLNKSADRISKMDKPAMFLKISQSPILTDRLLGENSDIENIGSFEYILDILEKKDTKSNEINSYPMITFGAQDYYAIELICDYNEKPSVLKEFMHEKGDTYEDSLYLPLKKWLPTIIIFNEYETKMAEVMPQWKILFTEEMTKEIAELAKMESNNVEYIKKLANILSDFVMNQSNERK